MLIHKKFFADLNAIIPDQFIKAVINLIRSDPDPLPAGRLIVVDISLRRNDHIAASGEKTVDLISLTVIEFFRSNEDQRIDVVGNRLLFRQPDPVHLIIFIAHDRVKITELIFPVLIGKRLPELF